MKNILILLLLIYAFAQFPVYTAAQNVTIGGTTSISKLTVETPPGHYGITHTDGSAMIGTYLGSGKAWFGTYTNQPLAFFTNNGSEQMTLLTNGFLGIGTTTPTTKLTIRTPNNAEGYTHISDGGIILRSGVGGISASIGTSTNHSFRLTSNNVNVINLDPAGNVGVGLADQVFKMDIADRIRIRSGVNSSAGLWLNNPLNTAAVAFIGIKSVDLVGMYGNVSGWGLAMNTNTGDVAVGNQNPVAGYRLSVHGNSYVNGLLYTTGNAEIGGDADITGDLYVVDAVTAHSFSTGGWHVSGTAASGYFFISGWGTQFELHDGDFDVYSTSDQNLKKAIRPLPAVLQKVLKLNPSQYYYKTDTASAQLSTGFLAQEVAELFPYIVHTKTDPDGTTSLSLAYRQFSVIAIKAIQEQQEAIDSMQGRMDAMAAQLEALEKRINK